jgi:hypothetical protein
LGDRALRCDEPKKENPTALPKAVAAARERAGNKEKSQTVKLPRNPLPCGIGDAVAHFLCSPCFVVN